MPFVAKAVSGTVSGDYFQLSLEGENYSFNEKNIEQSGSYLLLQQQFEFANNGKCYIESEDENYFGHFKLSLIEFSSTTLVFEIPRQMHNRVVVTFTLSANEFEETLPIVEVIFGIREPFFDDEC